MHRALFLTLSLSAADAQDRTFSRRDVGVPGLPPPGVRAPGLSPDPGAPAADTAEAWSDLDPTAYGEQEILVRVPHWQPWSFGFTAGWEYQDNAGLTPNREISDLVYRQSSSARVTIPLNETRFLDGGVQQQSTRYDDLEVLDFDRFDIDAGLLQALPESWPILGGAVASLRAGWYRLSEGGRLEDELFNNFSLTPSLLRSLALNPSHSILGNISAEISLDSNSAEAQRNEYSVLVAWQAKWSPRWESSLYLRGALYDYDGHNDWNFVGGAAIDWIWTSWCRLGVVASWTWNDSDESVFDYENSTLGAGLRLSVRF
ncbi:MAG: hypothetical protein ACKV19_01340 [Verrucomicrobiales bacterium]